MKQFQALSIVFILVLLLPSCATAQPVNAPQTANTPLPPPAWLSMDLTDVSTGKSFTINDFKGKVVLVDAMAIWCPNCLRQAQHLKDLRAIYRPEDLVMVTLDIDLLMLRTRRKIRVRFAHEQRTFGTVHRLFAQHVWLCNSHRSFKNG